MRLYSKLAFWTAFGIAFSGFLAIALTITNNHGRLTILTVLLVVVSSLVASTALAALIASFRYPIRWCISTYRLIMRILAKKAVRSSLTMSMTPVRCLGIMEREGYVQLRLGIGLSDGIIEGFPFQVLEATDSQLWGIVSVVLAEEYHCDCIPTDRVNESFWAALEGRIKTDTSPPPNVHFIVGYPPPIMKELTDWLLDNWR